jgi:hypothetical protein
LPGNLPRKGLIDAALDIDIGKLIELKCGVLSLNSLRPRARSACSESDCELTDTYSLAAIDIAPATIPATPAIKTSFRVAAAAATPTIKLAVDRMPSLAPRDKNRGGSRRPIKTRSDAPAPHATASEPRDQCRCYENRYG